MEKQRRRQIRISALVFWLAVTAVGTLPVQRVLADFQYGTSIIPSTYKPPRNSTFGPGSQINQAGVGDVTSPAGQIFSGFKGGYGGTDILVGTVTVTDLAIGEPYTDLYGVPITINLRIKDRDTNGVYLRIVRKSAPHRILQH